MVNNIGLFHTISLLIKNIYTIYELILLKYYYLDDYLLEKVRFAAKNNAKKTDDVKVSVSWV